MVYDNFKEHLEAGGPICMHVQAQDQTKFAQEQAKSEFLPHVK